MEKEILVKFGEMMDVNRRIMCYFFGITQTGATVNINKLNGVKTESVYSTGDKNVDLANPTREITVKYSYVVPFSIKMVYMLNSAFPVHREHHNVVVNISEDYNEIEFSLYNFLFRGNAEIEGELPKGFKKVVLRPGSGYGDKEEHGLIW